MTNSRTASSASGARAPELVSTPETIERFTVAENDEQKKMLEKWRIYQDRLTEAAAASSDGYERPAFSDDLEERPWAPPRTAQTSEEFPIEVDRETGLDDITTLRRYTPLFVKGVIEKWMNANLAPITEKKWAAEAEAAAAGADPDLQLRGDVHFEVTMRKRVERDVDSPSSYDVVRTAVLDKARLVVPIASLPGFSDAELARAIKLAGPRYNLKRQEFIFSTQNNKSLPRENLSEDYEDVVEAHKSFLEGVLTRLIVAAKKGELSEAEAIELREKRLKKQEDERNERIAAIRAELEADDAAETAIAEASKGRRDAKKDRDWKKWQVFWDKVKSKKQKQ